ncbi:hypothetical protein CDL15_Pgr008490 [Punica granatum]|uniref:Uncharacterized protein n=1 Tax=Punica granatum TaxID=22663 RepID=A0A218WNX4_PUNGR|nr:hypothetical protein CDL15_Pgr008490 [Punica granatum]
MKIARLGSLGPSVISGNPYRGVVAGVVPPPLGIKRIPSWPELWPHPMKSIEFPIGGSPDSEGCDFDHHSLIGVVGVLCGPPKP